jgi:hypothetical protein
MIGTWPLGGRTAAPMRRRRPSGAGCLALLLGLVVARPAAAANVLLVISGSTINASESARRTTFQGWGHSVTTIEDNSSQASFDAAIAGADVVYIPSTVQEWELSTKCKSTAKGVVCEERYSDVDMGFSTNLGWNSGLTQTEILNNTHPVTTGLSTGYITIVSSTQDLTMMNATVASGMTVLSKQNYAAGNMLGVIDAGGALAGGGTAAGRRVRLPWGGDSFSWSALNSNGLLIAQQAISWAAGSDLLLHWKLNEASGSTASDSSSYSRNGSVVGTASWVAGQRHNAHAFNGSNKIEVTSLLGSPASFTLACWVRIDAVDTNGAEAISVGDYIVLRAHNSSSGGAQGIFFAGGSTYRTVQSTTSYIGRGWHHYAVTFDDAADSLKLWIDGVNVATTSTTSSITWSGLGTKTRVGSHGNANTLYDLTGAVDDARVYNRALNAAEIADLYGLIGRWKLVETSGTSAADSSGKAQNGTYTNGPTLAQAGPYPGAGQYAARFDGTNDYVNGASASTNYDTLSDGFTIATWVYLNGYVNLAAALENGSTTANCSLAFSSTGQIRLMGRSSGGAQTHVSSTLPLGKWKHVTGTYDGSTFRVYVDGKLVSSAANSFTIASPAGNLTLGAARAGTAAYLNGRLHDVRFYNRAIGADEVADLYGLVGQWKLDETTGTTAADSSGAGNNGVYTNGPTLAQAGPYPGAGAFAPQFDGVNQHVVVSNINADLSNGFSYCFWARPTSTGNYERFADFGCGASSDNVFMSRYGTTSDLFLRVWVGNQAQGSVTAAGAIENNVWHHYVGTCDNAGNGSVYRDGVLMASGSLGTPANVLRTSNYIGRSNFSGNAYYQGRMDDVRLYNRPLSSAEVAEVYGLVGHWKLNEGAGTTLADSSGAGAGAAFNGGAPTWVSGIYSNALSFNGTTDDAITSSAFNPPSTGAIAYWFRSNGVPASAQRQIGLGDNWEVRQEADGLIRFDLGASGDTGGFRTASTLYQSNSWYHVVALYDMSDDSYAVYVNGTLDKSGTSTADLTAQSAAQLSFGTRTGSTQRMAGSLDDIRVYNRKLSPWEVYQIYGLMAWYKFDETSGTAAADATGRGQDGVFSGSPTLNVSANGAASQGTAVAFNGSNYMQASGLYDKSASVSAAAWVRLDGADTSGAEVVSLGDCFVLRLNSGTSGVVARYYNGSAWVTVTASQIVLNTGWHHFAAVLDGGSTLKVYVDGVEAASTAASGGISYSGQGSNTRVASHGNGQTAMDLTGRVDDVKVFNRALKPDEVFQLYRGSRISGVKVLQWVEAR